MEQAGKDTPKRYKAFISYSHGNNQGEGRKWADWLHHALETYEIPDDLIGKKNAQGQEIPRQIYPVFQDEKELSASSNLNSSLTEALDRSEFLIYLSSPRSAKSSYVRDEIRYFKKTGKSKQIIALILSGEPEYSGKETDNQCFPDELRYNVDADGNIQKDQPEEVLAADVRIPHTDKEGYTSAEAYRHQLQQEGKSTHEIKVAVDEYKKRLDLALLKIIAGILGVPLGELTKRDQAYQLEKIKKKNKNIQRIAIAISALGILAIIAGIVAWNQKNAALRNLARSLYASGINKLTESEYGDGAAYIAEATRRGDESAKLFAHSMLAIQDDLTVMQNSMSSNASYSPDGQWIATFANVGANNSVLQVWNAIDRKMVKQRADISTRQASRPHFDNKNRVYTAFDEYKIIRYNIADDKVEVIRENPDSVFLIIRAVAPSGKYLVFQQSNQLVLFDVAKKEEKALMSIPSVNPNDAYFDQSDQTLVVTMLKDDMTELRVFDLHRAEPKPVFTKILESSIKRPMFSESGKQIAFANQQGLHYVDYQQKKQFEIKPPGLPYSFVGINKNGTISAGNDDILDLFNENGERIKYTKLSKNLFFSTNLTKILAQDPNDMDYHSPDWTQEIVNANPLSFIKNIRNTPLKLAQYYADDNFLAGIPGKNENDLYVLNRNSNSIDLLNTQTGETKKGYFSIKDQINFIHFLPVSNIFIAKDKNGLTHAFDANTGKEIGKAFNSQVKTYVFNAEQTQVLARTGNNGFGIWDLRTGKQLISYETKGPLGGFTASPDLKTILAVDKNSWKIIDVQTKKVLKEEKGTLNSGTFNKQGTALVVVRNDGKASVLNTKDYKTMFEIPTIEFPFLVFNNKGNVVAISEDANHMRLWSLDTKKSFGQNIIISKYSKFFQFSEDDSKIFVQDDAEGFGYVAKLVDASNGNVLTMPFINKKFDYIHILPGEKKILTVEGLMEGKAISIWEIPGNVETSKDQLAEDLEKFYGKKYDEETGAILAFNDNKKTYNTWYFQDPDVRTLSPNSKEGIVEIIKKHYPIKTDADLQFLAVNYAQHPLSRAILADYFGAKPETKYIGQRMYELTTIQLPKIRNENLKKEVQQILQTAAQKLKQ
ncbi:toll/interleukin-1 receptor domain-containing protein [Sphingobacterium sp.]|uniref:toll/interleukin-1 receptor domain-containing protein n=1 Tax=Sphingobacterium sp. TaxID=341027 RepID=UPI00289A3E48|nr:toll/interleukin-1 receptor domain-containing protein [Sphingobacterium sp.]